MNIDWQLTGITLWNNTLEAYFLSLCWFAFLSGILFLIRYVIRRKILISADVENVPDLVLLLLSTISKPLIFISAFYISFQTLSLPQILINILFITLVITIIFQIITALQILTTYVSNTRLKHDLSAQNAFQSVATIGKFFVAILGFLFILQNIGVNVTSLIAGLGIGGIAIALAAQNVLGDLLSSFSILFDKPFVPGDYIVLGKDSGVVQKVGIKTTRIRALQGEEIIIPNTELTSARIQNFKRMEERRVPFNLQVVYGTPLATLKKIPDILEKIIETKDNVRFDRAHFTTFGDSALIFDIVYYVTESDYLTYVNVRQQINLEIIEAFEKHKIEFAHPTQTIQVLKN